MPGIGVMGIESIHAGKYFYYIFTVASVPKLILMGGTEITISIRISTTFSCLPGEMGEICKC